MSKKELEKIIKEVKSRMNYKEPQKSNKGWIIGIGVAVIAALIGLVLWIRTKNDEDIEEYYEYFDDEMEDELEDDELYGLLQEDEDDEDEEDIGYVSIKNFSDEDEDEEDEEIIE
ncbi:MAG: hypothetical protein ACRC1P_09405 [Cellulosilyticaceae bacterium]